MSAELTRIPGWRPRLRRYLTCASRMAVEPGRHDCCLFGAGAVEALTGVDLAAPWRGQYSTFEAGLKLLRKAGYRDHVGFVEAHLPEIGPGAVREGDIAIVPDDGGDAVGVVQGAAIYALTEDGRLGVLALSRASRFFRVGGT